MINRNVNIDKILKPIRQNKRIVIVLLFELFMLIVTVCYKNHLSKELESSNTIAEPVRNLDNNRIDFIKKHSFFHEKVSFEEFINSAGKANRATIKQISEIESTNIDKLQRSSFKLLAFFWHDSHIFKFLNELQEFNSGFLKLRSIEIDKFAKVNLTKPFIKVEIVCDIFQY